MVAGAMARLSDTYLYTKVGRQGLRLAPYIDESNAMNATEQFERAILSLMLRGV